MGEYLNGDWFGRGHVHMWVSECLERRLLDGWLVGKGWVGR